MMRTAKNFDDLKDAVFDYSEISGKDEPLVLVLKMPGEVAMRFIITQYGIVRQDCDREGRVLV